MLTMMCLIEESMLAFYVYYVNNISPRDKIETWDKIDKKKVKDEIEIQIKH